ncbi:50S ribosomal protein L29 [Syntrophorhabdus aromaticivorans]|jgi:large subunit ribosomal protein L29|uniref:Large ribosomal subunit protein uL29 n=1 Tax=Syntrophorhabdus aromaticivorans TaxID=328301 RepID=A0A971RZG7_9BACT|nr:50S ribosomal protein L29 [Syntrophorhabdus aromaticivorans]NLW34250.1 50S ribosomal protein L29 [Syntrophorhabdus aromaticivorans]
MKAKELRDLTVEELLKKKKSFKEEMFNLRFQHSTAQLENTARMRLLKRDVAKVETVLREKGQKLS